MSEDELSVVAPHRRAVFVGRISAQHMLGRHDSRGEYHTLADDVSANDLQLSLGAGWRFPFYDRLQIHGGFSARVQQRALPNLEGTGSDSATAVGMGDTSLFLRWSPFYDDQQGLRRKDASLVPSLDLYVGAKAPTGVYDDGSLARDMARTTGDGTWGLLAGARAIKYLTPSQAARLSLRYNARFARDMDFELTGNTQFSPGDQLDLTIGYLGLKGMRWMYGCTLNITWTLPAQAQAPGQDFRTLAGTAMVQTTLGAHVTRVLVMPTVDLTMSLTYTPPFSQFSSNVSWEGIQGGIAVRYHLL